MTDPRFKSQLETDFCGPWRNRKNGRLYIVIRDRVANWTNEQDPQEMVLYVTTPEGRVGVRERTEFFEKFERI